MKKLLFGLIATVMLSNYSFAQIDLKEVGLKISQRKDFVELIKSISTFTKSPKDFKAIEYLGKKEKLNEEDSQMLLKSLGFNSQGEAYEFDINNHNIVDDIYHEFNLSTLSNEELLELFNYSIDNLPENIITELGMEFSSQKRTCLEKLSSCRKGAWGVYIVEHAGCAAAGIGIGTLSFWCAGCVGAGVWAACATGASMHMSSMLDDCQDAYDGCKD